MTYPTYAQLDHMADTLTRTNWSRIVTRLTTAMERDRRGGTNIPDGYPTSTRPSYGAGSEDTSTERAALVRLEANRRDEHRDLTRQAIEYFADCARALAACITQLDRIEARVIVVGTTTDDDWCVVHRRHGLTEVVYRGHYCRFCYDFRLVERVDPPPELISARAEGKRITEAMVRQALAGRTA